MTKVIAGRQLGFFGAQSHRLWLMAYLLSTWILKLPKGTIASGQYPMFELDFCYSKGIHQPHNFGWVATHPILELPMQGIHQP